MRKVLQISETLTESRAEEVGKNSELQSRLARVILVRLPVLHSARVSYGDERTRKSLMYKPATLMYFV